MHEHEDAGVVHQWLGHVEDARQQPGFARLSSHEITLAAMAKVSGRLGALMVISCDAKMTRPDTQFDYVRGS